jgi:hypothetical protein
LTVVALTATPDLGSVFSHWTGNPDCDDDSVTMDRDVICSAVFIKDDFRVSVTKAGTGQGVVRSNPQGIVCGTDCEHYYQNGTSVVLSPLAARGSYFVGWSGDPDCSDGQLTVDGPRDCTATFDLIPLSDFTLTVTHTGRGAGTVTSSPEGIACGTDCTEVLPEGTVVTLTATPDPGSLFARWLGHVDCADGVIMMTADRTCTAKFVVGSSTLTISKVGSGRGIVRSQPQGINCGRDCSMEFEQGTVVNLVALPEDGSVFDGWSGDPDCVDGEVTLTQATTCAATFTTEM